MKKKIFFILLYHVLTFYVFYFSAIFFITSRNDHEDFIYSNDRNDFPTYYSIYEMKTVSSGNRIINALEDYYSSNGKYPEKLECLVPIYIKKIPRTSFRKLLIGFYIPFDYRYDEKRNEFYLTCRYWFFLELYYHTDNKKWKIECD